MVHYQAFVALKNQDYWFRTLLSNEYLLHHLGLFLYQITTIRRVG